MSWCQFSDLLVVHATEGHAGPCGSVLVESEKWKAERPRFQTDLDAFEAWNSSETPNQIAKSGFVLTEFLTPHQLDVGAKVSVSLWTKSRQSPDATHSETSPALTTPKPNEHQKHRSPPVVENFHPIPWPQTFPTRSKPILPSNTQHMDILWHLMTSYDILTWHLDMAPWCPSWSQRCRRGLAHGWYLYLERSDAFRWYLYTQSYNEAKHVASQRRAPSALKVWHCEPFSVCFSEQKMLWIVTRKAPQLSAMLLKDCLPNHITCWCQWCQFSEITLIQKACTRFSLHPGKYACLIQSLWRRVCWEEKLLFIFCVSIYNSSWNILKLCCSWKVFWRLHVQPSPWHPNAGFCLVTCRWVCESSFGSKDL